MDEQRAGENEVARGDVTAVTSAGENRIARRRANALATMTETAPRHGGEELSSAERYRVIVHVTAGTPAGNVDGRSEREGGQRLALETVCRIACDGS